LLHAFHEFKGDQERQDDMTVVGFGFHHTFTGDIDDAEKGERDHEIT
jgi:hypothetical protein